MILGDVDFPSQLVDAAIEGKLVIFAGAGVSMGAPANLPSFWKLAEEIAQGFGQKPREEQPLDQFLGSLSFDETVVQKAAVHALQTKDSKPKDLHLHLLSMFPGSDKVRVVTTNFDPLFTAAAEQIWSIKPEIFNAPALPLGYDFEGIVHLHGSNSHSKSIVITDRGFGKAYLTDGWASRFLMQMFETYTVLFVGYSHDDMVMSYLARALPDKAQGKRFALLGNSEISQKSKWHNLGIEPIYFPQEHPSDFSYLSTCTHQLSEFLSRQASDWQEYIGMIAGQDGPQDLEAEHTIIHALRDSSKVRYFTTKATSKCWVFWLYEQPSFVAMFRERTVNTITELLEHWLLNTFLCSDPDVLFELIAREHNQISHRFWFNLVWTIVNSDNVTRVEHWVDLLLHLCPNQPDAHGLQFLAEQASKAQMTHHVLRLFFKLAMAHVRLKEKRNYEDTESAPEWQAEFEIQSPEWNLNEVWQKSVKPHLPLLYKEVLLRGVVLLKDRLEADSAWSSKESAVHLDSWSRSAIEPHEQDDLRHSIDVVIDAMRDSLEAAIDHDPVWATRWCNEQQESENFVLCRLAIHGLRINRYLSVTTKLSWILRYGIHRVEARHEIFVLIQALYPSLAVAERHQLIDAVFEYQGRSSGSDAEHLAWEHWQWLYALCRADERCPLLIHQMDILKAQYPKLKAREYPDLHTWTSEDSSGFTSPWNAIALLSKNSKSWFAEINHFNTDDIREFDRWELIRAVQEASQEQPLWALTFCDYLTNISDWESDLWPSLLAPFSTWPVDESIIKRVIDFLSLPEIYKRHPRAVVRALKGHLKSEEFDFSSHVHQKANQVVATIWTGSQLSELPISGDAVDWINQAINTLEGDITKYWISALDRVVKSGEESQYAQYFNRLSALADTDNPKTVYSVPILCRQINFVYHVDARWTVENILLLLEPESDRTEQGWHGLLSSGGIRAAVFSSVRPYFEKMRGRFDEVLIGKENKFIEFYVAAGFWHIEQPHLDWLPKILGCIVLEQRSYFAVQLSHFFAKQTTDNRTKIWTNWFKPYWQNRIEGRPMVFDAKEAGKMLSLLADVPEVFEQAVELAVRMPAPDLNHSHLLYSLQGKDWIKRYSNSVAVLITYLLKGKESHSGLYGLQELLIKINIDEVNKDVFDCLNQALITAGRQEL